jgi:hypothetical protein
LTVRRQLRSTRIITVTAALLLASAAVASAHDLFLKPVRYFVTENADVLVRVLNGTFSKSENSIARPRVRDISVVSPAGRARLDTTLWSTAGDTSTFSVHTGASGTYVLGASTNPNVIALKAKDFNEYLQTDGVPDILSARRRDKQLGLPARERYSKHVKALIQVGASRSNGFPTELGYSAEIVPQENPYALQVGGTLHVRTLVDGRPVANQFVLYGGRTPRGQRIEQRSVRSNAEGVATIPLRQPGTWYVKFISMRPVQSDTVDYESKWATLTFQLR